MRQTDRHGHTGALDAFKSLNFIIFGGTRSEIPSNFRSIWSGPLSLLPNNSRPIARFSKVVSTWRRNLTARAHQDQKVGDGETSRRHRKINEATSHLPYDGSAILLMTKSERISIQQKKKSRHPAATEFSPRQSIRRTQKSE